METTVSGQILEIAASLALGVAFGVLYDILRTVRRRVPLRLVTLLCDLVFCTVAGCGLFLLGLTLGGGKARAFLAAQVVLGGVLYSLTLTRATLYVLEGLADVLGILLRLCAFPVAIFLKTLKKVAVFSKNLFNYWRKWYIFKERRLLGVSNARRYGRK